MSFTIEVVSVPDREEVVVEIWHIDAMVAELRREDRGVLQIDIYSQHSGSPWSFELKDWLAVLAQAQKELG